MLYNAVYYLHTLYLYVTYVYYHEIHTVMKNMYTKNWTKVLRVCMIFSHLLFTEIEDDDDVDFRSKRMV